MLSCLENGNRYEGSWERGMKNGHGRFFHLDHGQLFEGFWVDNVAKCGTMIDFGRDEAPEPTQFPIPKVGSPPGALKPERQKPASWLHMSRGCR